MRAVTELPTSELFMEMWDLGRESLPKSSDVRKRIDELIAEIDRRIPIDTYVRAPGAPPQVEICSSCGHAADDHPYRHIFTPWRPGMPKPITRGRR